MHTYGLGLQPLYYKYVYSDVYRRQILTSKVDSRVIQQFKGAVNTLWVLTAPLNCWITFTQWLNSQLRKSTHVQNRCQLEYHLKKLFFVQLKCSYCIIVFQITCSPSWIINLLKRALLVLLYFCHRYVHVLTLNTRGSYWLDEHIHAIRFNPKRKIKDFVPLFYHARSVSFSMTHTCIGGRVNISCCAFQLLVLYRWVWLYPCPYRPIHNVHILNWSTTTYTKHLSLYSALEYNMDGDWSNNNQTVSQSVRDCKPPVEMNARNDRKTRDEQSLVKPN